MSRLANLFVERMLFWWRVIIVIGLGMLTWQLAVDRDAPFRVEKIYAAQAYPGDPVTIHAEVWRDMSRECAVEMDRYVIDSYLQRTDYPRASFSPADIASMEKRSPSVMRPTVLISPNAVCGPATMVSNLYYSCNQAQQWILPIHVRTELPFTVLCR